MGNLCATKRNIANQPFINHNDDVYEELARVSGQNKILEMEIKYLKRELDGKIARVDNTIHAKYTELLNSITYYNEQNNEKIKIITKDMENLLNNDKILLDKLIEKNIVSTIQDC